ncbi:MAG: hypothetical protein P8Y71_25520 [Pseudolabrys sp.]|jgi:hypothetical protein
MTLGATFDGARVLGPIAVGRIDVTQDLVNLTVLLPSNLTALANIAQPVILTEGRTILSKKWEIPPARHPKTA